MGTEVQGLSVPKGGEREGKGLATEGTEVS